MIDSTGIYIIKTIDSTYETIPPPSNSIYISYNEAYHALKSYTIQYNYKFLLHHSRPHHLIIKTHFYYRYDRYRTYISKATTRQTNSHTTDYLFNLIIIQKNN